MITFTLGLKTLTMMLNCPHAASLWGRPPPITRIHSHLHASTSAQASEPRGRHGLGRSPCANKRAQDARPPQQAASASAESVVAPSFSEQAARSESWEHKAVLKGVKRASRRVKEGDRPLGEVFTARPALPAYRFLHKGVVSLHWMKAHPFLAKSQLGMLRFSFRTWARLWSVHSGWRKHLPAINSAWFAESDSLCLCAAQYMALPASQYSVLDAKKIDRIDDCTFRCYVNAIKLFNLTIEPILTVRVTEGSRGPTVKLLDTRVSLKRVHLIADDKGPNLRRGRLHLDLDMHTPSKSSSAPQIATSRRSGMLAASSYVCLACMGLPVPAVRAHRKKSGCRAGQAAWHEPHQLLTSMHVCSWRGLKRSRAPTATSWPP